MIPAPPGIYAEYLPDGNYATYRSKQIVAFDDDGCPLVASEQTGQLIPAQRAELGFKGVGGVGKVIQVIPAPGWIAEYELDAPAGGKEVFRQPLVGWALHECGDVRPLALDGNLEVDSPGSGDCLTRIFHVDETFEYKKQSESADQ